MTWLAYSHLGVAKTVQLTTQPAGSLAGIPFSVQPVGRLVDGSGVLSRATGVTVTASKASGTGTLSGTLSVQTVEGVFTFTDLKMDTVTSAVTLQFASSGLTSAVSNAFNVTQPNTIIGIEAGAYVTTGTAAALSRTRVCQCTAGSYSVAGAAVTLTGPSTGFTDDGFYIATYEAVNANTVLAEDFMRADPGDSVGPSWYNKDCDQANASGGLFQDGCHGWCGSIYANPITPAKAVRGGGAGVGGKTYCGTHGVTSGGAGGRNMADHALSEGVTDLYMRYYVKPLAGYLFGAEKMVSYNKDGAGSGGIYWGNLHCNMGGSTSSSGALYWQVPGDAPDTSRYLNFELGNAGHWYYLELRLKLSTTTTSNNGILQFWADDMGTDGISGPASPTQRFSITNFNTKSSAVDRMTTLWFENWANPGSVGEMYIDYIYCSKAGPIGFQTVSG